MRYHLILDECPATSRDYWGKAINKANKLVDIMDDCKRPYTDQVWHVLDTKTGKVISPDEFWAIFAKVMTK